MVIGVAKYSCYLKSRVVWDCSSNKGDRFHLKLNITGKPIAKKYCEGKVKRTLKAEVGKGSMRTAIGHGLLDPKI